MTDDFQADHLALAATKARAELRHLATNLSYADTREARDIAHKVLDVADDLEAALMDTGHAS